MICNNCKQEIGNEKECPFCHTQQFKPEQPHYLSAGTMIGGKYRIEGVLGEGGFGITYRGYNDVLNMTVAIKEYFPHGFSYRNTADGTDVVPRSDNNNDVFDRGKDRFLKEAKTLVRFNEEPGVVSAVDYIEENGTAYLVMEYLEGVTLQQYLKQNGTMSADEAFGLLQPVMTTLAKIHSAGVIHRDISPDNIMRLHDGRLKLMDFGAARDYDSDNRSMSVMLKQGYAPEEQYRRTGNQGPWTDVYALCATIYRCITGKTPVDSLDRLSEDTMQKPSSLGADISPALEKVLLYGLAVRKQDRCQSMSELLSLVERAGRGEDLPVKVEEQDDENRTVPADGTYLQHSDTQNVRQNDNTINTVQNTSEQLKPKKKRSRVIIFSVIALCIVIIGVLGYFVVYPLILRGTNEPESTTWTNEVKGVTYYYEFQSDGTFKGYLGTIEMTGNYTKSENNDKKTITVDKAFGTFSQNQPATYSISGFVGNRTMTCSSSHDFTLKEAKREEYSLDPPENFTPDKELLGSWLYSYIGSDIYRITFNADGTMILEFIQDGVTYNGIYTISGSTINFTYYADKKDDQSIDYSVNGDNLTFMGYDFVREGK